MSVSKVMIIDDDRTTTGLLKILLELDGFEVTLAPKGETAVDKAKESNPDAFLIDINLADSLGTDVVRRLRAEKQFAKSAIVMTSGLPKKEEALAAGSDKFLLKPFEPDELVAVLKKLLGIN